MSVTPGLPHDPGPGQRLLDDLLRRNDELRQQAQDAQRRIEELERLLEQDHWHQQAEAARQQAEDAQRRIDELERVLEQTAADYQQLQQQHDELAETLALLRRYLFGQRRERFTDDPGQGHLFDIPEILTEPEPAAPPPADDAAAQPPKAARPPRRTRLDHLPHIRIEHDLPEDEKTCSCCGGPKQKIGEDISRELDFIPAQLEVKVHVLPKYACPKCRDGVASPPVPPKPIPGGIAGAGLVAFVVVSKFADHLPLYRLEDILTRHGVFLRGAPCATGSATPRSCWSRWPSCRRPWCCSRRSSGPTTPPSRCWGASNRAVPRVGSGSTSAMPSTRTASTTSAPAGPATVRPRS